MAQRKRRLDAEPLCRDCDAQGIIRLSVVPDHIVPLARGGTDTDDNIRCLCAACHKIRTAEQFGQRVVHGTDLQGRPNDPAHPWNRKK
jgi:5-methylcytosine-specific restriction protein A